MKSVVICADDFGIFPRVNEGIIALVEKERLSAVSCMTNSPFWFDAYKSLLPFYQHIDIGLHFNLTEGAPASYSKKLTNTDETFFTLRDLLIQVYTGKLDEQAVYDELSAQYDNFTLAMGVPPHFIDGHQHIHQIPVIRDMLLAFLKENNLTKATYIRSAKLSLKENLNGNFIKACVINLSGGYQFEKLLCANQIRHNTSFSGSYAFNNAAQINTIFPKFLKNISHQGLIMCHPGFREDDDLLANSRELEFHYLNSEQFLQDLKKEGISLEKFHHE